MQLCPLVLFVVFLPIVERELRVRARDKGTWRIRLIAAGAAFLVGAPLLLLAQPAGRPGLSGQQYFYVLTGLTLLFCIFDGLRHTADSISGERREGTLGLLFLTDLKGYDIVLGKLAVSSINSLFGLLAIFPILSLGLLAGGITVGEFWRMSLALTVALAFSMAAGTWVSARGADERRTMLTTTLFMGAVAGGLPLLDALLGFGSQQPLFTLASPLTGCFMATDWAYRTGPHRFWLSQATCLLAAMGLLAHAALTLQPTVAAPSRSRRPPGPRRGQNSHDLDRDPIAWLASSNTAIPRAITSLLIVSVLVRLFQLYATLSKPAKPGVFTEEIWLVSFIVGMLTWFLVAYLVSDFFLQLRRAGLLELLLSTPLSSHALARGHQRAIWRMLRWPAALWLGTSAIGLLPIVAQLWRAGAQDTILELAMAHLVSMTGIALSLLALTYAGAWFALNSRTSAHALAKTVSVVLLVPFVIGTIAMPLVLFVSLGGMFAVRVAQPLTIIISDILIIVWAGKRLKTEFRQAAVRQITGEPRLKPERNDATPVGEYFGLLGNPR